MISDFTDMCSMRDKIAKYRKSERFNFKRLNSLVDDTKSSVEFLQEMKILPKSGRCDKCEMPTKTGLVLPARGNYVAFRCGPCKRNLSIRRGTFFYRSLISYRKFVLLLYTFVQWTWTYQQIIKV